MFAGLYKKGSGVGSATAFLYSGPAINILAIVYTANLLGFRLGLARAIAAITMAFVIAFLMSNIFKTHDEETSKANQNTTINDDEQNKPILGQIECFEALIAILVVGASGLSWIPKLRVIYILTVFIALILIYYYK